MNVLFLPLVRIDSHTRNLALLSVPADGGASLFAFSWRSSYQIPWSIMALMAAFLISSRLAARSSSLTSMSW